MKLLAHPLDRVAVALMVGLGVVMGLILWAGDHTVPLVRSFSWQGKQVGAEHRAFILEFNRTMAWEQVAQQLQITPQLPGKLSWSGRRLAYTLTAPMPYGQAFQVALTDVPEANRGPRHQPKMMRPFASEFRSRDRAFVYLGVNQAESGRLILYNLTQNQKTLLTPADLIVSNFQIYPLGDRILFSANSRQTEGANPQLYTVTTGMPVNAPDAPQTAGGKVGKVKRILDNKTHQILKFDLAPDGSRIVVQRAIRQGQGLGEVSLWQIVEGEAPQVLKDVQGGEFLIAPDGRTLVLAQGQGLALLPLDEEKTSEPLDFLPQFGMVLSFSADGSAATMVRFNKDYTRSLFLVTNQGKQLELLKTTGSILMTAFDPDKKWLYCLLTELQDGEDYVENPYLAKVDLATGDETRLIELPQQLDVHLSLAPDGSALLLDQVVSSEQGLGNGPRTDQGASISTSNLWLLPLESETKAQLVASPAFTANAVRSGLNPKWLP